VADEPIPTPATPAAAPPGNTGGAGGSWDEPSAPERFIHNAATAVVNAAKGAAGMGKEILFPEGDTEVKKIKDIAHKLVIDPAAAMEMKARTAKTPAESIGYSIAEGIPLVGPYAAQVAEETGKQAGSGDIAGAAGTVVGNLLAIKAGDKISEPLGEAAKAGAEKVVSRTGELAKHVMEDTGEGIHQAVTATAPEGGLEAGFAKLGGKTRRSATPKAKAADTVSGEDVVTHLQNTTSEKISRAEAHQRVGLDSGGNYRLTDVPTASLEAGDDYDPKLAKKYADKKGQLPAIVLDGDGRIRDGNHRLAAAQLRGEPTIKAYVPIDTTKPTSEPEAFASVGGKFVGKTPEQPAAPAAPAEPYHPDLQKVMDLPGVTVHRDASQATDAAHFVTPDGKFVRLPAGADHDRTIERANPDRPTMRIPDNRVAFSNDTGVMNIRPTTDASGKTLSIKVPKDGITPNQVDALKQAVGQGMKSRGSLLLETADKPSDSKSVYQEMVSPRHIDDMAKEIGVHPDQAKSAAQAASVMYHGSPTKGITQLEQVKPAEAPKEITPLALKKVTKSEPSDEGYVYHATNEDRAYDIASDGLKKHGPSEFTDQYTWPDGTREKRNYFTKTAEHTWQFAPEEGKPVLIRTKPDIHFKTESTGDVYTKKVIQPEAIEILGEDNNWHPISNLKESETSAKAPIPKKLKQSGHDNMSDPATRAAAAEHEAAHSVVSEMLEPGSVNSTGLTTGGGVTDIQPPAGKTTVGQLAPDEVRNMVATSLAGGMMEPGGTTSKHASGDLAERKQVLGGAPSAMWQGIQRLATGGVHGVDPMLQNNQTLAEGKARVDALLADPAVQQHIKNVSSHIAARGKLSGDEVRAIMKPPVLTASK
jgi:hypothetical protein